MRAYLANGGNHLGVAERHEKNWNEVGEKENEHDVVAPAQRHHLPLDRAPVAERLGHVAAEAEQRQASYQQRHAPDHHCSQNNVTAASYFYLYKAPSLRIYLTTLSQRGCSV